MAKLSKFDVLFYLSQTGAVKKEKLQKVLMMNILFRDVSERMLSDRLAELRKEGLVKDTAVNYDNPKAADCLAFLYWSRMKGRDYNSFLDKTTVEVFRNVFEKGPLPLAELVENTGLSKPTVLKRLGVLKEKGFILALKRKPLVLDANMTDLAFFYANFLELSFKNFEKRFDIPDMPRIRSKKLIDILVKLHAYSTTVTEGNTATEDDVKKIFNNRPVRLTPQEVSEILNAKAAVNELFSMYKEDVSLGGIKRLHKVLMNNLIDKPGEVCYGAKKIAGFKTKLPSSKEEIHFSTTALLNFCRRKMKPLVLASLIHFIFVSIHPFADGNGRVARLFHSWVLLKTGLPLFVYDPDKRNEYFMLLEKGRDESVDDFIKFCIREHYSVLRKITG